MINNKTVYVPLYSLYFELFIKFCILYTVKTGTLLPRQNVYFQVHHVQALNQNDLNFKTDVLIFEIGLLLKNDTICVYF